jgi:hypothetical protein
LILADKNVIRENWKYLGKKRSPPIPETITDSPDVLRKFMDKEERRRVVEGRHS